MHIFIFRSCLSPLHLAAMNGDVSVVKLLLQHGAKVDADDGSGQTPLFLAANWSRYDAVELLIEHGANVNRCDTNGL